MLARLLNLLDRRSRATQAVALVLAGVGLAFLARLELLDSPERWMPRTTLSAWRVFERHFDAGDNIGVGLHFRRDVRDDDLARLAAMRHEISAVEGINRVYDCSLVAQEIERVSLTELLAEQNRDRFALYRGVLWDAPPPGDETRTLMTICELEFQPGEDIHNRDELNARRRRVVAAVDEIVQRQRREGGWGPRVDFHVASGITMMAEMEKRTRQVALTFLPASILVGLASLLLSFRSGRAVVVAMVGGLWAMTLVLGLLAAMDGALGVVTVAAPALMSIVAIASTVHIAAHSAHWGTTGQPPRRRRLVRWVAVPCFGAAATTGVGFLMLAFNELAPVRDLGLLMFAGSILAFFGVFIASQVTTIENAHGGRWITAGACRHLGQWTTRRPAAVVFGGVALVAAMVFFAWPRGRDAPIGLRIDADPFSFFADDEPIKVALEHFSDRKFAVYQLDVVLIPRRGPTPPEGLNPPDPGRLRDLAAAERFADKVAAREDLGVLRVLSTMAFRRRYEEFLQSTRQTLNQRGLLEAFLTFGEQATSANVLSHSFRSWSVDKAGQGALRVTFVAHDTAEGFKPLVDYVRQVAPDDGFECHLAGSVAQNVDLAEGLSRGMIYGLATSFVVMGLLCGVLFRSVRLAAIAILPNVFPVLLVFGVMGAFAVPISSGSAMVATIALGIALNDTIHFMLHYRQRTREGGTPVREAALETVATLGRPIVLTSLVHVAGFTIFLTTDFLPLYHFGLFASLAMLGALLGDLVLLPNLLVALDRPPVPAARPPIAAKPRQHLAVGASPQIKQDREI